jgi:Pentapeptide repeats (8 copies)
MTREEIWRTLVELGSVEGEMPVGPFKLVGLNLEGIGLRKADLRGADLVGANLRGADLVGTNLMEAYLMGTTLVGANLIGANLMGTTLVGANLRGADLREANLMEANLMEANLRGANLRGANLREANLEGADLMEANLMVADLRGAIFEGAVCKGAVFEGAVFEGTEKSVIDILSHTSEKKVAIIFEPSTISGDEVVDLLVSLSGLYRAIGGDGLTISGCREIIPVTPTIKRLLSKQRLSPSDKKLMVMTKRKLQIDLAGTNPETFDWLFTEFTEMISGTVDALLQSDSLVGGEKGSMQVMSLTQDFFEAKLQKHSLENLEIMAEIEEDYASEEEKIVSAGETHHETRIINIDNAIKKLRGIVDSFSKQIRAYRDKAGNLKIDISVRETG